MAKHYATFEISGNEAIILDNKGETVDTVDLLALVEIWLDEQGYEVKET